MRLPMKGDEVDIETASRMVDEFLAAGFCYFDTAHGYHDGKSEAALKAALTSRYPREKYILADKLSPPYFEKEADIRPLFEQQLEACGVEYFDMYLMHAQSAGRFEFYKSCRAYETAFALKAEGKVRHVGISFHDTAEVLESILQAHPEMEFVQLQINYVDWESEGVQSRKCYEVARKYNKPVIIMEPVRGGSLAIMPPQVQEVFKKAEPEMSVASWAIRYAASLEGVLTVLSGMSTEEQLNDNVSYMEDFKPLDEAERATVQQVVDILNSLPTIPCTACKYCVDGCPQKINIPSIFRTMNDLTLYNNEAGAKRSYANATKEGGKAGDCIQCGNCEAHCPQKIEIIETLKKAAEIFG